MTLSIFSDKCMTIHRNIAVLDQQPSLAVFFPLKMFLLSFKVRPKLGLIRNPPNREKNFLIFLAKKNYERFKFERLNISFIEIVVAQKVTRPGFAQNHFKFKACWVLFWPAQVHKLSKREAYNFLLNPNPNFMGALMHWTVTMFAPIEEASRITFCSYLQTPDLVICHVRLHILTNHLMPERREKYNLGCHDCAGQYSFSSAWKAIAREKGYWDLSKGLNDLIRNAYNTYWLQSVF